MIFPPAFLDSSCWNSNQLQPSTTRSNNITSPSAVSGGEGEGNLVRDQDGLATAAGTLQEGGGDGSATAKPMSMSERARLARIPQPAPGIKCPRCDSTNTKFCYFNNYSLSQPRHFCRACRRYWTRGGALRSVPVGGGYRRHAKRAKPKATASAASASAVSSTAPSTCTTAAPTLQAMLSNNASSVLPSLHRFTDFDTATASLGLSFPGAAKLFVDTAGGGSSTLQGMEQQWRAHSQMQGFPFLHAMDHQMGPATAIPATMAMQGVFHLGLERGGGSGVNSEDGLGGDQFHAMPTKREEYPIWGMHGHGDVSANYTCYPSSTAGAGNLL